MKDATPEELLAGLSRRPLPVKSADEARRLLAEMRWQCELHISDPLMKAYLDRLGEAIVSYIRHLEETRVESASTVDAENSV